MKSKKTGPQRRTNQQKLKRTQANLAVRRAISDQSLDRRIKVQTGGMPVKNPETRVSDVRVTSGWARYEQTRWQRIKNWFRRLFGRQTYPKF